MERNKKIIRTSILGILALANVFLAGFKAVIGMLTNSIAITLDAVNNLSDAMSSIITIIGTRLAGKQPDKKHPYGYGRIEYLSATIISVIILYAGITSFVESMKKIIHPKQPEYMAVALIIIAVAVAVKIVLGIYVKRVGEEVKSDSLIASGKDAMMDSVISASTLVAAGAFLLWNISLEAWLGAIISMIIIKSGLEMLGETISEILGERVDSSISKEIKETVKSFPEVFGVYDLILHNYGPDTLIGSLHIEIPDTCTMERLDELQREIVQKVYTEHGVILTGISVYSLNTQNDQVAGIMEDIRRTVMAHEYVLEMHGFYLKEAEKSIQFDIIIDFAAPDRLGLYHEIVNEIEAKYPNHTIRITLDVDVSD